MFVIPEWREMVNTVVGSSVLFLEKYKRGEIARCTCNLV